MLVTPKSALKPAKFETALMPLAVGDVTVVAAICTVPDASVSPNPFPVLSVDVALASTTLRSAVFAAMDAPPVALIVPPATVAPALATTRPAPASVVTVNWPSDTFVASTLLFFNTTPFWPALVTVVRGTETVRFGEF